MSVKEKVVVVHRGAYVNKVHYCLSHVVVTWDVLLVFIRG